MTQPTNDEKLETIFQYVEKHKREAKKEKYILRGLCFGIVIGIIILIAVIL